MGHYQQELTIHYPPKMSAFCLIDDKRVPLYRIVWISDLPHLCGEEECQREGQYEIRLESEESVWTSLQQRDATLEALEIWLQGRKPEKDGRRE